MGFGLGSAVRLAATVVAAAAVARAAESARQFVEQLALKQAAERRALPAGTMGSMSVQGVPDGSVVMPGPVITPQPAAHHPFGPTPSVVPSRGIGFRTTAPPSPRAQAPRPRPQRAAVSEPTPIDMLRARRNADRPTRMSIPEESDTAEPAPEPAHTGGRHRRDAETDGESMTTNDTEFTMSIPMGQAPVTLRLAVGPQNTLTLTVSLPGATVEEPL